MKSPFQFGKIVSSQGFINREKETAKLISNARNGINTILISPRRWGKSSLMAQCAHLLCRRDKSVRFVLIDLFNIRTEEKFYETLATQIIRACETKWRNRLNAAKRYFKHLIPKISFSPSPGVEMALSFEATDLKRHHSEILDLAENIARSKKIRIVICIDEFQKMTYFDDSMGFQKILRSHWQRHQHVCYFISASKRSMMSELFEKPRNPFFKFGDVIILQKIERKYWQKHLPEKFAESRKSINADCTDMIIELMDNHPYFIQQLAHEVWIRTQRSVTTEIIQEALSDLYASMSILYQREVDSLSRTQVNFLNAVADGVERFSTTETLRKYNIGTSANVKRIKEALEQKEVIDLMEPKIDFVDPLFKLWFKRVYLQMEY